MLFTSLLDEIIKDYNTNLVTSPRKLLEELLSDIDGFYKYESNISFTNEDERIKLVKKIQEKFSKKCKE